MDSPEFFTKVDSETSISIDDIKAYAETILNTGIYHIMVKSHDWETNTEFPVYSKYNFITNNNVNHKQLRRKKKGR